MNVLPFLKSQMTKNKMNELQDAKKKQKKE